MEDTQQFHNLFYGIVSTITQENLRLQAVMARLQDKLRPKQSSRSIQVKFHSRAIEKIQTFIDDSNIVLSNPGLLNDHSESEILESFEILHSNSFTLEIADQFCAYIGFGYKFLYQDLIESEHSLFREVGHRVRNFCHIGEYQQMFDASKRLLYMCFSHIPLADYNRLFLVWWESDFSVTMDELKTQLLPIQDECSSIDTKIDEWNPVSKTDISLGKQSRHTQDNCNYLI